MHIFVLVHVKQVCQVFPAPTPQCVVQIKWNTASGILPSNEHKQRDSTNFCVCVVYTTLPPRASMKLRCSIFDQFLGRKTGVHQHFRRLGTWHGWNEATNLTDWCEQAGISDYLYTYTSYFILSSTHGKSVITCYLIGHGSKSSYNPNMSQQMKDWGTKDFQVKSVALLIP